MAGRMVSPADLLSAAREHMLGGREPKTHDDWILVVNFVASNIDKECALPCTRLFCKLFDVPLGDSLISQIVSFHLKERPPSPSVN